MNVRDSVVFFLSVESSNEESYKYLSVFETKAFGYSYNIYRFYFWRSME